MVTKTKKIILPLMFAFEYFGANATAIQKRKNAVVKAQLDVPAYKEVEKSVQQIQADGLTLDNIVLEIAAGNRTHVNQRDELCTTLSWQMYSLSNWILHLADTPKGVNTELIKFAGYKIAREPQPKEPFSAPKNLRQMKSLFAGTVKVRINSVTDAPIYYYEIAKIDATGSTGPWDSKQVKFVTYTFTDLTPGMAYCVRVGAADKDGKILYSPSIKVNSGWGQ